MCLDAVFRSDHSGLCFALPRIAAPAFTSNTRMHPYAIGPGLTLGHRGDGNAPAGQEPGLDRALALEVDGSPLLQ